MALKTTLTQPTASGTGTVIATPGMPGAANPVRIVGRNASGAPTTGTFQVGDVVVNTDGTEYVCSVAGTPGTWVQIGAISYGTPSNIDASITSLSAGSLTTVARADHIHTLSNAAIVIGRTSLTSTAASVTFSSISSAYHTIILNISAKTTSAVSLAYVDIRFNNDTSSNYLEQSNGTNNSATFCGVGYSHGTSNTLSASGALNVVTIHNANSTSQYKTLSTQYIYNNGTTGTITNSSGLFGFTQWRSTTAISTITIFSRFGDIFDTGTTVTVWGLR